MNSFIRKTFVFVLLLAVALTALTAQSITEKNTYTVEVTDLSQNIFTTKYGNLWTTGTAGEFTERGFAWGDIVQVSFLGQTIDMPVVPTYSYVPTGETILVMAKDQTGNPDGNLQLAINMGDFTTTYGIATKTTNADKTWYWTAQEGVGFPLSIRINMKEKEGFLEEFLIHDLQRTDNREDYPQLSDEQFANFRIVGTTGMHGKLYRSSSPISDEIGRNAYADAACRKAGITVAVNLADDRASAENHAGFKGSYYSTLKLACLNLGVDLSSPEFQKGLAEGLRFMISNPGTYVVHCAEGKDRAGFVSAILECLMGASADEVVEDYMVTYYNYYGVEKGSAKYQAIANGNIVKSLEKSFGISDLYSADLASASEGYLKSIGLSSEEIKALKANL